MLREFNYTNRRKILREHVEIQIIKNADGDISFNASIDLSQYGFEGISPEPRVFVEAYRGATATWKRFSFGGSRSILPPSDLSLNEFRVPEGILFRVRVTSIESGSPGKLLAEADALQAKYSGNADGFVQPLIQHMAADDIGDELWRIHYSDGLPILKVNEKISIGAEQFLMNPEYRAAYAPSVMRQILQRILLIERFTQDDDELNWKQRWIRFSTQLTGRMPPEYAQSESIEEIEEWIDDAIEAFCRSSNFLAKFNSEIS